MRKTLKEEGFTLIEAMIALFILLIGVVGLLPLISTAIDGNASATRITFGSSWVTDHIEFLINQPYDAPSQFGASDPLEDTTIIGTHGPITSPDSLYSITWTVDEDTPMANLKSIEITVQYTDRGQQKSIVMDYVKPAM